VTLKQGIVAAQRANKSGGQLPYAHG